MKRIFYVFAMLVVSAFAAEAQQRAVIGNMDKPDTYLLKPGTVTSTVEQTMFPVDNNGSNYLPLNILADTTFRYAFTVRAHPFPDNQGDLDTTRTLRSRTNPDSTRNVGDMFTGVALPNYTFNGFAQFVPFAFYIPEFVNGNFRIDSLLFYLYPTQGPVTSDMEVWIVALPQPYTATYKGYNFDIDNLPEASYISQGPLMTMTADSINAHIENNTIRPTILDLQEYAAELRTVPGNKVWGVVLIKSDRSNTDQLAMIGVHEWTLANNQTFGGVVGHTASGTDSVVTLSRMGYRWSLSTESYPAYANQIWKLNYRMNFYGEFTGELALGVEQESPVADAFTLEQNAPNPVNGDTKINFSVAAENSYVTLRVYNTLGQEVAELVNGNYGIGKYNAMLNTAALPAGSYVYVLNANGQTFTRTLQVVR
jgi:hypothetical protein